MLTNLDPMEALVEDFSFEKVLLAMEITNTLSTDLLPHYRYENYSGNSCEKMLQQLPVVGGILNAKAIVHDEVVCIIETGEQLLLTAASKSQSKLGSFFSLIDSTRDQ